VPPLKPAGGRLPVIPRPEADVCATAKSAVLPCPYCDGRGSTSAFVDTGDSGWYDPNLPCSLCRGSGHISQRTAVWLIIGQEHSRKRKARDESIRECARRLGIRAAELSGMEHGRADPERLKQELGDMGSP
jgi:hypothetical protein